MPSRARLAGVKSRLRRRKAAGEGRPAVLPSPLRRARNVGTGPPACYVCINIISLRSRPTRCAFLISLTNCSLPAAEKRLKTSPLRLSFASRVSSLPRCAQKRRASLPFAPKVNVQAASLTRLICDIRFGSGGNLFCSPGTDTT